MAASGRKQNKKTKHTDSSADLKTFDFDTLEEKKGSLSDDDARDGVSVYFIMPFTKTYLVVSKVMALEAIP